MVKMVMEDPARLEALKANPLPELEKLREDAVKAVPPAYIGDTWLYRTAIIVLGLLALSAAFGSIILVLGGKTTPEVLVALGSAAVGALVGLFAPSPTGK
jgi:hypothetical protein